MTAQTRNCLLLSLALTLILAACGGRTPTPAPSAASLSALFPAVGTLDGLASGVKGARNLVDSDADLAAQEVVSGASALGSGGWEFENLPQHSWVVFRLPVQAGSRPLAVHVLGSSRLWMICGDFATGRWVQPQLLDATLTRYDLTTIGNPVSPAGNIYVGFVLTQSTGGVDDRLTRLRLHYDSLGGDSVFYVAPPADGGNDANPGTEAAPWATLQFAADTVQPGESVVVMPGEYTGFHLQTSGLPGAPITFSAQPGAKIVEVNENTADGINLENWDGPPSIGNVVIEGFYIDGDDFPVRPRAGIRTAGSDTSFAHDIVIRNNRCFNCDRWGIFDGHVNDVLYEGNECAGSYEEHGIYHSNSGDRATIRGNILHHNHGCGLHMNGDASAGGDGVISDCLIENNVIYENAHSTPAHPENGGGSGINCDGVQDSDIRNNLLYDNHASGISLYMIDAAEPASGNKLTNNTVVVAVDGRWAMNIIDGSTGATLRNNIFMNRHSFRGSISITPDCMSGFVSDSNAVMDRLTLDDGDNVLSLLEWRTQTNLDQASHVGSLADMFVDATGELAEHYQLRSGSSARNSGGMINAPNFDLRGVARPQDAEFDIGCFEMDS